MSTCDLKRLNEWIPFDLLLNYNPQCIQTLCCVQRQFCFYCQTKVSSELFIDIKERRVKPRDLQKETHLYSDPLLLPEVFFCICYGFSTPVMKSALAPFFQ